MKINGSKIATATTLEKLTSILNQYYYSTTFRIEPDLSVHNKNGPIFKTKVIEYKGGYLAYHPDEDLISTQ